MIIELKKFGTTLSSRPAGKEAFLAFQPRLREADPDETLEVDFDGVIVLGPSWADEFITPLLENHKGKILFRNTSNPSVEATLELLKQIGR